MDAFRYVHISHLLADAPFCGLESGLVYNDNLGPELQMAPAMVMENLFALCRTQKPAFIIISGPAARVDASLPGLAEMGIPLVIALRDRAEEPAPEYPAGAIILKPGQTASVPSDSHVPLALIHHAKPGEPLPERDHAASCLQLACLHAQKESGFDPASLAASSLDAWALDYGDECRIFCPRPMVAAPGKVMGAGMAETGPRGCLLLDARKDSGNWNVSPSFVPLAPIQWENIEIDPSGATSEDQLARLLDAAVNRAKMRLCDAVRIMIAQISLKGSGPLPREIFSSAALSSAKDSLAHFRQSLPQVWIKEIDVSGIDRVLLEECLSLDDLRGSLARMAHAMLLDNMAGEICANANLPLAELDGTAPFSAEEMNSLFLRAQCLCQESLERR